VARIDDTKVRKAKWLDGEKGTVTVAFPKVD
jgi:hypothetical protein